LGIVIWLLNHAQVRPRTRLTWSLLILPLVCVLAVFLSMALSFILDLGALLFAILLEQSIEGSLRHSDGPPVVKDAEAVAGEQ